MEVSKLDLLECRTCVPGTVDSPLRLGLLRASQLLDEMPPALDRLTALTKEILKAPVVLVSLVDIDRQVFVSEQGLPEPWKTRAETPLSHSFCQHVVTEAKPLIVSDAREDVRLKDNLAIRDLGVIAYAGFPIVADSQVLGSFCAIHGTPHEWEATELRLLREFAEAVSDQVAVRLDHQEIVQAKEALAQVNRDLEKLADVLCHDLQAPLRGISGCLGILESNLPTLDDSNKQLFALVLSSSARMRELIEALHKYSRSTTTSSDRQRVSLDKTLADVQADIAKDIENCGATISVESELGETFGFEPLLRQLFQNLLSNALKFQPQGQKPVIGIGRDAEDVYYVRDNGIGMASHCLERIFQIYNRANAQDAFEGLGIGLAVCSRVVTKHGGRIWVESELGEGTTFFFTLSGE